MPPVKTSFSSLCSRNCFSTSTRYGRTGYFWNTDRKTQEILTNQKTTQRGGTTSSTTLLLAVCFSWICSSRIRNKEWNDYLGHSMMDGVLHSNPRLVVLFYVILYTWLIHPQQEKRMWAEVLFQAPGALLSTHISPSLTDWTFFQLRVLLHGS